MLIRAHTVRLIGLAVTRCRDDGLWLEMVLVARRGQSSRESRIRFRFIKEYRSKGSSPTAVGSVGERRKSSEAEGNLVLRCDKLDTN